MKDNSYILMIVSCVLFLLSQPPSEMPYTHPNEITCSMIYSVRVFTGQLEQNAILIARYIFRYLLMCFNLICMFLLAQKNNHLVPVTNHLFKTGLPITLNWNSSVPSPNFSNLLQFPYFLYFWNFYCSVKKKKKNPPSFIFSED